MDNLDPPPDRARQTLTNVFVSDRQRGKTSYIVSEFLNDPSGLLIVVDGNRKKHIINASRVGTLGESKIFTIQQLRDGHLLRGRSLESYNLYIDDIEDCLMHLLSGHVTNANIAAVSITGNIVNPPKPKEIYTKATDLIDDLKERVRDFSLDTEEE